MAGAESRVEDGVLLALDVDDVVVASSGSAPPGSKGLVAGSLGELLVVMVTGRGVVSTAAATVWGWLARRADAASAELTIDEGTLELGPANGEELSRPIQAFIQSHQRS